MNDYFLAMKPFENKIPLMKASLDYVVILLFLFLTNILLIFIQFQYEKNLVGSDPPATNTKILFVQSKSRVGHFEVKNI